MAETNFLQYLKESLNVMLTNRADEMVRATYSTELYMIKKNELRPQAEIDDIVAGMKDPIEKLVDQYVIMLKKYDLTTPEKVKSNGKKIREITAEMEMQLEDRLKQRLEINDN